MHTRVVAYVSRASSLPFSYGSRERRLPAQALYYSNRLPHLIDFDARITSGGLGLADGPDAFGRGGCVVAVSPKRPRELAETRKPGRLTHPCTCAHTQATQDVAPSMTTRSMSSSSSPPPPEQQRRRRPLVYTVEGSEGGPTTLHRLALPAHEEGRGRRCVRACGWFCRLLCTCVILNRRSLSARMPTGPLGRPPLPSPSQPPLRQPSHHQHHSPPSPHRSSCSCS